MEVLEAAVGGIGRIVDELVNPHHRIGPERENRFIKQHDLQAAGIADLDVVAEKHFLAGGHLPDGSAGLERGGAHHFAAQRGGDADLLRRFGGLENGHDGKGGDSRGETLMQH